MTQTSLYHKTLNLLHSSNSEDKLFFFFTGLGADTLHNQIKQLDFGEYTQLVNRIIKKVCKAELEKIKAMNFSPEIEQIVKKMNTRRLLAIYNSLRNQKDEMFYCIRKELSAREHVPNKLEAKEIRRNKSGRKVTRLEKKNAKIKEEVIKLKNKGYSVKECASKFNISRDEVLFILKESGYEDYFYNQVEVYEEKQSELVHYDLDFRPVYQTWQKVEKKLVSKTYKAAKENKKQVYDHKFGFKKEKMGR